MSRLVLIGNPGVIHVGAHLTIAARELGLEVIHLNSADAFGANPWRAKFNWWVRGHRPTRLREFSREVVDVCRSRKPRWVLSTGIAPIDGRALRDIGDLGISRVNFLTDDPWNPAHRAPWFMDALRWYDHVYSPRRVNVDDLRNHGCACVDYLPFGYAPHLHFPEACLTSEERIQHAADVVFAGGADCDRVPVITALIRRGLTVALYGNYWNRFSETRRCHRGHADPGTLRKAIAGARVALCLVRRANRDGSSMRTFEVAAMGGCMLADYTDEHREILGEDGEAAVYFRSTREMVDRVCWLLGHDKERRRLSIAANDRITTGRHSYKDRLGAMLASAVPAL